ncbi:MAG: flippase-like domain-containing protein [Microthrixaceae bacterium]|nr:flippase-like domain-containing protein [Microthrixaceae bacterium]
MSPDGAHDDDATAGSDERAVAGPSDRSEARRPLLRPPAAQAELVRRPGDAVSLVLALVALVVLSLRQPDRSRLGRDLFQLVNNLPDAAKGVFDVFYALGGGWIVLVTAGLALAIRRRRLARDLACAGLAAWVTSSVLAVLVDGGGVDEAVDAVVRTGTGPSFPLVRAATVVSLVVVAAPYLTRPLRRLGWATVAVVSLAGMYLAVGSTEDVVGGLLVGWAAGKAVLLAFGSPAGRPSTEQVRAALAELGIDAVDVRLAPERRQGATLLLADVGEGPPLSVKVLGRDQRDAQFLSKAWRWLTTKDSGPTLYLTRRQEVEHEAFVGLLAARGGAAVPEVLAAGTAGPDAALLVERRPAGRTLDRMAEDEADDALLDAIWAQVGHLRAARIAHGSLSADHLVLRDDGHGVSVTDFGRASTSAPADRLDADVAEVLAWTALLAGEERAGRAALRGAGAEVVEAALPTLQPVALTRTTRHSLPGPRKFLGGLRSSLAGALGVDEPALQELRRVKPQNLFMAVATLFAVVYLLGQISELGDLGSAFADASWGWVVLAFCFSLVPRLAGSTSLMAASPLKLQLGPTVQLQYATAFTTLATPGGYGASVMNIRYLQRRGMDVTSAVGPSLLVSWSGSLVQGALFLIALVVSGQSFDATSTLSANARTILLAVIALGVAVGVLWRLPKLRNLVVPPLQRIWATFREVFAHPRRASVLLGSAAASSLGFALCLGACLHAYGGSLSLANLVVVNIGASTLSSVVPVPGGMGVAEAAMVAGLTALGVPTDVAVPAVITHRILTFWLPPPIGWFTTRSLLDRGYL